jgi:PAS domain-containing protein
MANGVREFLYENVIARREITSIADRFDTALNNMPHGLVMVDPENRIQVINRKACELLKIGDPERLKERDLGAVLRYGARYSFMDSTQPELILRQMTHVAEGKLSRTLIHFPEDLSLEFSASRRADGGAVLIFEDVSSRVKAEQKILHMVRFDALTRRNAVRSASWCLISTSSSMSTICAATSPVIICCARLPPRSGPFRARPSSAG